MRSPVPCFLSVRSPHPARLFLVLLAILFTPSPLLHASSHDIILADAQALSQLEARALQASPREQCFLFTELVSGMTELAGKQILDGDIETASVNLKKVEHYSQLIHLGLARDTKRLKNAEMLMHHTTFRLNEILHKASSEDRATLQSTLKQLNSIQDELLTQVFQH